MLVLRKKRRSCLIVHAFGSFHRLVIASVRVVGCVPLEVRADDDDIDREIHLTRNDGIIAAAE